jgi:ferredoxin
VSRKCPVNAIYQDKDLPADQRDFIEINREYSLIWPPAISASEPLPECEQWRDVPMKRQFLQDLPGDSSPYEKGA